jgi:hypothetical protein
LMFVPAVLDAVWKVIERDEDLSSTVIQFP